jgi:dTDP-4-amino-4,6-dideoxygalactose transaminase
LERGGRLARPRIPPACGTNGHIYYILLPDEDRRRTLIDGLLSYGIHTVFHYVPLHDSPGGRRYGRASGSLPHTNSIASRILRLPMHLALSEGDVDRVVATMRKNLETAEWG